jgi:hypothetical protein
MKKGWLLVGLVAALWFSLFVPVAAQEEETWWGYQWGFPYEIDRSWKPQFVEPVQARELWGFPEGPTAQAVWMGYPDDGDGFREVEFLGYQDRRMGIQEGPVRFHNGWPAVVVSPPMWDHQGKVQFVVLNYWRDLDDEPWQGSWKAEDPPHHLVLCYIQSRCPHCWPFCPETR